MGYSLAEGVSLERADGMSVFLVDNGDAAVLDAIGGLIADELLSGDTEACTARLVREYDVTEEDASRDVIELKEKLLSLKLIKEIA